jgi:hypothetical protein
VSTETVPTDDQLTRFENDIRRLKIEFDIFFNGGAAKPPVDLKYRVDSLMKQLYDVRGMTFAQRFRYNTLVARYNAFKELWRRNLKEREEGGRALAADVERPDGDAQTRSAVTMSRVRCTDPHAEPEKVRELFDSFVRAKRDSGNRVQGLSLDRFEEALGQQMNQIKSRLRCDAVVFTVELDHGSVKLTARAG